jgi:hypothetical protein
VLLIVLTGYELKIKDWFVYVSESDSNVVVSNYYVSKCLDHCRPPKDGPDLVLVDGPVPRLQGSRVGVAPNFSSLV